MKSDHREKLIKTYRDGLLNNTLPFWFPSSIDKEYGGFLTCRDRDGSLLDNDKGVWQQCRATWLLATLYNKVEKNQNWLSWSRNGIDFISKYAFENNNRMWFHVTREGKPIRKRRYFFTECFGSIAYAAFGKATGEPDKIQKSLDLYKLANQHFSDSTLNNQKYTDTRPVKSIGPLMIKIATAQELRSNLNDNSFTSDIKNAIEEIEKDFLKPELECLMETVSLDGGIIDHFDGRTLNPGHAIECAWFILWEAKAQNNDKNLIDLGCQILDWMWGRGWDDKYGGLYYFRDVYNKPVQEYWHDMKFWWPHNETIIATLLAWTLTKNDKYLKMHTLVHNWAYKHFEDQEHGEWFGYVHRDGRLSSTIKGNLWKGPFHLPRMQLTCWRLLENSTP